METASPYIPDPNGWLPPAVDPKREPRHFGRHTECQYLKGQSKVPCGAPTKAGSSFCAPHHKKCYLPIDTPLAALNLPPWVLE